MQITIIRLQVWTVKCTVDMLRVRALTSSQLLKTEGDCSVNIHIAIPLTFLENTRPDRTLLFFPFIFSKHQNVLTTHSAISIYRPSYGEPCGDLLQQSTCGPSDN